MPIIETPKGLEGTAGEDELSQGNKEWPLSYVSDLYDKVVKKVEEVLVLDGKYEEIKEDVFVAQGNITQGNIKQMTRASRDEGKIFYIFHIPDMPPLPMRYFDINFVIAYAMIIIMAGKRYLVIQKRREEGLNLESIEFHFIKIEREDIAELIESNASKEVILNNSPLVFILSDKKHGWNLTAEPKSVL